MKREEGGRVALRFVFFWMRDEFCAFNGQFEKVHSQTNAGSEQHPPSLMANTKAESSFPGASLVTRGGTLVRVY